MSYQKLVLISPVLLLIVVESSWALSCISCYTVTCPKEPQCAGGKVLDPCGCCYKCAKQKNESCGGVYGFEGSCDMGLKCVGNFGMTIGVCKEKELTDDPEFMAWLKARRTQRRKP